MVSLKETIYHLPSANPAHPVVLSQLPSGRLRQLLTGDVPVTTAAERWLIKSRHLLAVTAAQVAQQSLAVVRLSLAEVAQLFPAADPAPSCVWCQGTLPPPPYIVVIGPRRPSDYAVRYVRRWVAQLARSATIVSGLAYGIDTVALETAVAAGGRTIAIVPTGVAQVYPAVNRPLAARIVAGGGAVLSEFIFCSQVSKLHFLLRNRLMAALADVVWVPEAAHRSGTMTTVRLAVELGKTIAVLPADIDRVTSTGSNQLLADGALCVTQVEAIADLIQINLYKPAAVPNQFSRLVRCLSQGFDTPDKMVQELATSPSLLLRLITEAVRAGVIQQRPDGSYQLPNRG